MNKAITSLMIAIWLYRLLVFAAVVYLVWNLSAIFVQENAQNQWLNFGVGTLWQVGVAVMLVCVFIVIRSTIGIIWFLLALPVGILGVTKNSAAPIVIFIMVGITATIIGSVFATNAFLDWISQYPAFNTVLHSASPLAVIAIFIVTVGLISPPVNINATVGGE